MIAKPLSWATLSIADLECFLILSWRYFIIILCMWYMEHEFLKHGGCNFTIFCNNRVDWELESVKLKMKTCIPFCACVGHWQIYSPSSRSPLAASVFFILIDTNWVKFSIFIQTYLLCAPWTGSAEALRCRILPCLLVTELGFNQVWKCRL